VSNFVFNIAKGRAGELYGRVEGSDPTNAVLVVIPIATTGIEAESVLEDADTFAAVVSGSTNEATGTGWARKVLSDSDLAAVPAPDDTNDRYDWDLPDLTWTAVADAADDVSALVVCYDPDSTGGADSALVPLSHHDFVIQPDGSDVTATISGWFRAS
jgi:hypothetical protein